MQSFIAKYQKIPVEEYPNLAPNLPLVSVCIQTYNHANYIFECLDGVIEQKTEFQIEVLIGEDDSRDETREICIKYAQKHPNRIRLFLHHRTNNIKLGGSPSGRFNMLYNMLSARGKYIALCEGDDYWTDPYKLQKQIDLLESKPECSACFTNAEYINEIDNTQRKYVTGLKHGYVPEKKIIINGGYIYPTASLVFRANSYNPELLTSITELSGDELLIYNLLMNGKIYFLDQITCIYRHWGGGAYSSIYNKPEIIKQKKKNQIIGYIKLDKYSNKKYHKLFKRKVSINSLYIIRNDKSYKKLVFLTKLHYKELIRLIFGMK